MQHYGLPTRLLDWSSNLLVGLYFCRIKSLDKDGALFIFDPTLMESMYKFNELLEMQVQEKSRSDFFSSINLSA
uniref:FRG domain-containing protein n=1 Tax=Arsenophonus endosymbiont of Trialeurodes vaporariorum TaxID=235567 RepID=A0A3B0MK21_9GAMM